MLAPSGCSTISKPVPSTDVVENPSLKVHTPKPDPIVTIPVKFVIYSEENAHKAAKEIMENPKICLSVKNYENLALNMAEILRYLKQANDYMNTCSSETKEPTNE